jgi:hypothetical protein
MQKLSLLYSSGAPPEQPHPELVQDEAHLAEFLKALVPLIETNKNVSGLCNHPQATFELEFLPNIDLSNIDARSYIPPALQEGFDNQVADWRDKNFIELLPKGWTGAEMGFTAVSQPEKPATVSTALTSIVSSLLRPRISRQSATSTTVSVTKKSSLCLNST